MVLRSLPRCRAIAEIVQPWRRNACTSMSSSRVSMSGGAPLSWCVVRDHQPQGSPACLGGATRVGNFSEQVWGLSHERHHRDGARIEGLRASMRIGPGLRFSFATKAEPLLWIADAVAGAESARVGGDERYAQALEDRLIRIDIPGVP